MTIENQKKILKVGKRKNGIASLYLVPGRGNITVNKKDYKAYFGRETLQMIINQPFDLTNTKGKYDVIVNAKGGGASGQAGAIRHGISKALLEINPNFRAVLKKAGFITRDARKKERKKYGLKGARARFQFSKR